MSDDSKPLDLSSLTGSNLGPAWVSEIGKPDPKHKEYREFEERPGRGGGKGRGRRDDRRPGGRGRRDDRPGGGARGRGGQRNDRDGRGRRDDRGRKDDRRGGKGGGRHGRRDGRDGGNRPPREDRPPEGITVDVQPVPAGLDSLATWIRSSGRTTSLIDIAKALLRRRELYQLRFRRTSESAPKIIRCEADGSIWTTKDAAIGHWIGSGVPGDFYAAEKVEIDPPKGNFTAIAVCGMSGVLLGPPNYHTYQSNLHRLHRERFSHIPLERFKSRIKVEHGEEIVEKWKAQQSVTTKYRWLKDPDAPTKEKAPVEEESKDQPVENESPQDEVTEDAPAAAEAESSAEPVTEEPTETEAVEQPEENEEAGAEESAEDEVATAEGEESAAAEVEPTESQPEETADAGGGTMLESVDELRRHALTHHGDELFVEVESAIVPGNIPGKKIDGPLFTSLKATLDPLRRFPAPLVPGLCQKLEGCGLKIFRWGKALFTNGHRPRPIDDDANLSEGISKIVSLVRDHPGISSKRIVKLLTAKEDPKKEDAEAETAEPAAAENASTETTEVQPEAASSVEAQDITEAEAKSEKQPTKEVQEVAAETVEADTKPEQEPQPEESADNVKASEAKVETKPEEDEASLAVLRDLRWLVHEGYLIEFTDGKIFLYSAKPAFKPAKKKSEAKKKTTPQKKRKPRPKKKRPTPESGSVSSDAPTQKIVRDTAEGEQPAESQDKSEAEPADASPAEATAPVVEPEPMDSSVAETAPEPVAEVEAPVQAEAKPESANPTADSETQPEQKPDTSG